MSKSSFLVALNLAFAVGAYAGNVSSHGKPDQPAGIAATRTLNWDEFKESCTNPSAFQNQRPPQSIRIQCTDTSHSWTPAPAGTLGLPCTRNVRTAVFSDKYHVDAQDNTLEVPENQASCPAFKEIEQTMSLERSVSCEEILSYKGDLRDFCSAALDDGKASSPKLIQTLDTGRVLETCANASAKQQQSKDGK